MLAKLALRNVRRQLGNYLIYFITVSFTVALMFAVNGIIFENNLTIRAETSAEIKSTLIFATTAVAIIVAFILGYATSYMLKLRKREFGTYLTLGMTRKNILSLFIWETLLLFVVSLAVGFALGLAFYQGVTAVVVNIMDVEFALSAYPLKGALLTVGLVALIFLLSSLTSAMYLMRVKIHDLIYGGVKSKKKVRFPVAWLIAAIVALATVVVGVVMFYKGLKGGMDGSMSYAAWLVFVSIVLIAVGVVVFHIGLAKSAVNLLLRWKRFKCVGANTFTLRKLSEKLNTNAVASGVLAFLLAFAVIGANVSFVMQISNEAFVDQYYPYDISVLSRADDKDAIPRDEAERTIEKYSPIKSREYFDVYTDNRRYLVDHVGIRPPRDLCDEYLTESDFNRIYGPIGFKPIELDGGFVMLSNIESLKGDFTSAKLDLCGRTLDFKGWYDCPEVGYDFIAAVVPDDAVCGMDVYYMGAAYMLENARYDAMSLHDDLLRSYTTYFDDGTSYEVMLCEHSIREYARLSRNSFSAVFIVAALYVAVTFVFMVMALLALKTLSDSGDDKRRFDTIDRLGASRKDRNGALFGQTFSFFFMPFILPLLLSIPAGFICSSLMTFMGLTAMAGKAAAASAVIAVVVTAIYALYFTSTYLILKRNVIKRR